MKYDSLSRNTVKITLSEAELREYSLCAETLCARTAETKRGLARLLKRMKLFSGYKAERLFLEAFPRADGGCILYVSSLGANIGETVRIGAESADEAPGTRYEVMGRVESFPLLVRLCAGLCRFCGNAETRVYAYEDGSYRLILSGDRRETEAAKHLIGEYGETVTDDLGIRAAAERGRLICGESAAEKIGGLF